MLLKKGFHLFEILIVLAIIGILSVTGVSSFSQYFVNEKRLEAENELIKLAVAMETFYVEHHSYRDATFVNLNFPEYVVKENYKLSIQATDQDYLLLATPLHQQADKDKDCDALTLNAEGEKGIKGTGKIEKCWGVIS